MTRYYALEYQLPDGRWQTYGQPNTSVAWIELDLKTVIEDERQDFEPESRNTWRIAYQDSTDWQEWTDD